VYYFERRIPRDLQAHYGKTKIVRSLRTSDRKQASLIANQISQRLASHWAGLRTDLISGWISGNQIAPIKPDISSEPISLSDAHRIYIELKGRSNDRKFCQTVERSVSYLEEIVGDQILTNYSRADANCLRDALIEKGLVASSIKRNFAVLRSIFNTACREAGFEAPNPFSNIILTMAPKGSRRQSIPIDKIRFLQSQCYAKNDDRRWLIALISDTGIRLAEACGLLAEDIIINHQIPHLVIRPHHWRVLKTESSTRKVPLVEASLWAAQNLAKDTSSLFAFPRYCSETGVKADSASGALNKWIRPYVPKGCVIHSFRHSLRDRLRARVRHFFQRL